MLGCRMSEIPKMECIFIGGSANGKRFPVNTSFSEVRVASLSGQPALQDPEARAMDDDPIPDESVVYEIYRQVEVDTETGIVYAYVLNGLSDEAVSVQLAKHFGTIDSEPSL